MARIVRALEAEIGMSSGMVGQLSARVMIRCGLAATVAGCLCLLCWLGAPTWSTAVLGRYSVKWFVGALVANVLIAGVTVVWIRFTWRRRTAAPVSASGLSLTRKALFAAVLVAPIVLGAELGLRYFYFPAAPRAFRPAGGTAGGFHALLQHSGRTERDGRLVRAYRGRVYDRDKGTRLRVVCLGGSTTWGQSLEPDQTWPLMLEEKLRLEGHDVEVINAGRTWYTTAHSVTSYATQMRYYDPDIVIVMHGVNDLARSFSVPGEPPPEWDYGSYQGPMQNVLSGYRKGLRHASWSSWHPARLLTASAIYRLAFERADVQTVESVDVGLDRFPTLDSFGEHLRYLTRLIRDDGRRIVLATQAHVYDRADLSTLPKLGVTMREVYMKTATGAVVSPASLRSAMRAVRAKTIDIAGSYSAPLADVERAIAGRTELFLDDFHLNEQGNAVVAQTMAEVLRPLLEDVAVARLDESASARIR